MLHAGVLSIQHKLLLSCRTVRFQRKKTKKQNKTKQKKTKQNKTKTKTKTPPPQHNQQQTTTTAGSPVLPHLSEMNASATDGAHVALFIINVVAVVVIIVVITIDAAAAPAVLLLPLLLVYQLLHHWYDSTHGKSRNRIQACCSRGIHLTTRPTTCLSRSIPEIHERVAWTLNNQPPPIQSS